MANGNGTIFVFFLLNIAAYILFAIDLFNADYKINEDITIKWVYFTSIVFFLVFLLLFLFREKRMFLDSYALRIAIISLVISLVLDYIISARLSLERVCEKNISNTIEKDCKENNILLLINSYTLIIIKTFTLVFISYISCPQSIRTQPARIQPVR